MHTGLWQSTKSREYISNTVKRDNKHRKRERKDSESRRDRQVTLTYYLGETVVCKRMFLNTLDVGEIFVRNSVKATDPATHIVAERRKPEHCGRKLADEKVNLIKNHIKSFPVMESHCIREQTKRKYLSSNLNLCKMYDLFLKKHADIENLPKICSYTKIFLEKFNLGFHKPKKDQCSQCNAQKNMTPEQKKENEEEHQLNFFNKKIVQYFAFDLQKMLQTPYGETGELYYYSKFAVYNLTCFDMVSRQGYCFVWDETIAKRGASEISSCLYSLFADHCTKPNKQKTMFADNCPGQNKNRYIIEMISMAVRAFHNLKSIVLMFLERGDTIERSKKGITINHPQQWVSLIQGACKSLPYIVKEMEQGEVLNVESELDGSYNLLINGSVTVPVPSENKKNVKNVPIKWREIRAVCFERE